MVSAWPAAMSLVDSEQIRNWGITELSISKSLSPEISKKNFPPELKIPEFSLQAPLKVSYTIDPKLQGEALRILEKYNPDYGIFVALDPETGHVLAMIDSSRDREDHGNMSLINTYPAASVSKIITAVAALNENKANNSTKIPFNGKSTSLYKRHVLKHTNNQWTRNYTFRESFAKSVNPVFGRLGAVTLGGETMIDYSYRLGFNGRFASDFAFDNGYIELDPEDQWQVAEMASGYTTRNTLSPMHGAILAATAVNGGNLVAPILVKSLTGPYGIPIYVHETPGITTAMTEDSASQLKAMMESTVSMGSARKSFRGFSRKFEDVRVGGKTGSLTGYKPKGKYDWFVGFGENDQKKIAFAVLCINKEKWYVKSTRFAREVLEFYFHPDYENKQT
jgi:peptidoglycan glycosyltransferase